MWVYRYDLHSETASIEKSWERAVKSPFSPPLTSAKHTTQCHGKLTLRKLDVPEGMVRLIASL